MFFIGAAAVRAVDHIDKLQGSPLHISFWKLDSQLLFTHTHRLGNMSDSQ